MPPEEVRKLLKASSRLPHLRSPWDEAGSQVCDSLPLFASFDRRILESKLSTITFIFFLCIFFFLQGVRLKGLGKSGNEAKEMHRKRDFLMLKPCRGHEVSSLFPVVIFVANV
ncbi:hypothetical protein COLO4_32195 [Corchorus olitorius]|uniref:Uncharacterized protein n=1 Tax=Corchorus olitorius TaxID=93759 RepID=A0A1R3H0H8_9ROSI|nr:hypothetical protein COLO4_32195 [Corchorus olitorius]